MSIESSNKAEFPDFIKLPILLLLKEGNENLNTKDEYLKTTIRINPFHISSYYPGQYEDSEGTHTSVTVVCSGSRYAIDMEIEEFDKIMESTDRGLNFKETKD